MKVGNLTIEWLEHDGFRFITREAVVYVDPFQVKAGPTADVVLITHEHFDHLHPDSLRVIGGAATIYVTPENAEGKIQGHVRLAGPGDRIEVVGVKVEVMPAYNQHRERQRFHPKPYGGVGYVFEIGGKRIYHAGDTDAIPEMKKLKHIDIALLPVSGTYVMDAEEAAEAVKVIRPQIAIPMHYGSIVGNEADARRFQSLVGDQARVEILEPVR